MSSLSYVRVCAHAKLNSLFRCVVEFCFSLCNEVTQAGSVATVWHKVKLNDMIPVICFSFPLNISGHFCQHLFAVVTVLWKVFSKCSLCHKNWEAISCSLFVYFTDVCLIVGVIAQETEAFVPLWHKLNTSVTVQRGFLHLQSISLLITVQIVTCKMFCQSPRLHSGLFCWSSEVLQLCLDSKSKARVLLQQNS